MGLNMEVLLCTRNQLWSLCQSADTENVTPPHPCFRHKNNNIICISNNSGSMLVARTKNKQHINDSMSDNSIND